MGTSFGFPTGLSTEPYIEQLHSICLLSKLSEEVYPDKQLVRTSTREKGSVCIAISPMCLTMNLALPARDKKQEVGIRVRPHEMPFPDRG